MTVSRNPGSRDDVPASGSLPRKSFSLPHLEEIHTRKGLAVPRHIGVSSVRKHKIFKETFPDDDYTPRLTAFDLKIITKVWAVYTLPLAIDDQVD